MEEYEQKETLFTSGQMRELERWIMLQTVDSWWKDHLLNIDHLKDGIGLRGYAQRDPLQEYKREAFELFKRLVIALKQDTLSMIFRVQPNLAEQFIKETQLETEQKAQNELKMGQKEHEDPEVFLEHQLEEQNDVERKKAHFGIA